MIHAYYCTDRHCSQCEDCLAEGESKFCSNCFDYMEQYNVAIKRRQRHATYTAG